MTIKELYEQAVADGVEDYELVIFNYAERHYPEYYDNDIYWCILLFPYS